MSGVVGLCRSAHVSLEAPHAVHRDGPASIMSSMALSDETWRRLAKVIEAIGTLGFMALFCARLTVFFDLIWDRPLGAQPARGWTEHLGWGRYGLPSEAATLNWLF